MIYEEAAQYLDTFLDYERMVSYRYPEAFSLDRMERLLDRLGNPHRRYLTLHVAGTKGKGSTCAFAASILKAGGWRVGLYTSPHLTSLRERIQVNGRWISEEEFAQTIQQIRPVAQPELTYFELLTACAFLYFAKVPVDVAVVEVGMGGRLDATNLLHPEVTVITPISRDHTPFLGDTVEKIAWEKAGILKPGVPVVLAPQEDPVDRLFQEAAPLKGAPLHRVAEEGQVDSIVVDPAGSGFNLRTPSGAYPELRISLLGRHQITNAVTALRMVELLRECRPEIRISSQAVREGLAQTLWPGRCQLVEGDPPILLDGAHNAASAQALRETIQELFPQKKGILVFGTSVGKDLKGMAACLGPWAKRLILTRSQSPRAESPERMAEDFRRWHPDPLLTESVPEALHCAQAQAQPPARHDRPIGANREDLVVVTGSLFLVGESLKLFGPIPHQLPDLVPE